MAPRFDAPWWAFWPVVFLANLPVPLYFSWWMTDGRGKVGVLAALGLLFVGGWNRCVRSPRLGSALVPGGVAVALFQVYPIPQMVAGILAVGLAQMLGLNTLGGDPGQDEPGPQVHGYAAGLVVTLVTGGVLILMASACGGAARVLFRYVGSLLSGRDGGTKDAQAPGPWDEL